MNTNIKNEVTAAGNKAQYDARAKRLLGNKYILAHILNETIPEFKGEEMGAILSCIEDDVKIASIPVEPGETNRREEKERIQGDNTEDNVPDEGTIYFDILFHARLPEKEGQEEEGQEEERVEIIVNIEAQKARPSRYHLANRAVYYACRMVSSQKTREFSGSDFDRVKRVYGIWICMNMPSDGLYYMHLVNDCILGKKPPEGGTDLVNILFVELAKQVPGKEEGHRLHRLLGALFSKDMKVAEKQRVIHEEYGIPLKSDVEEGANIMCNLSEWIEEEALERGRAEGEARGEARGRAEGEARGEARGEAKAMFAMYRKGYSVEQIADVMERTVEETKVAIEEMKKKEMQLV